MAQTAYVEHIPISYEYHQPRYDYTCDYSSDVSSPASSSGSPQHSPLLSDDDTANHWFANNPVEVVFSSCHIEPSQEYTPLAPMDSSCLHYINPHPEAERHVSRTHHRGTEALRIEKLEDQVYAVFGRHRYCIDPEDKFDASNCYPPNVAVVTHTGIEETIPIICPQPPKRAQGTSRNKRLPRAERLWEFILRLLLDPNFNPSHIEWVDREKGMFRLVNSRAIARMWGKRKNNLDMTYEKLSRAMRYYYHRKILQPVFGKKLVYKFGPNSTGWQLTGMLPPA
ncbi:ETS homologous factor-like [Haliotis rubra]|uniref:ETS homologous factor-like n=1 Tax=Haliotis rubra TaxID=36100 RepID=UPI001EE5C043|nr:ETS homologous factor-like [Haliotis rubra]